MPGRRARNGPGGPQRPESVRANIRWRQAAVSVETRGELSFVLRVKTTAIGPLALTEDVSLSPSRFPRFPAKLELLGQDESLTISLPLNS